MASAAGCALMLVALPVHAAPAPANSVKSGVDAWSRGDFAAAIRWWEPAAAAGDADAQFNLAQAYKLGQGVPADLKKAEALYFEAARQGHVQAADIYGLLLFQSGRREEAMAWIVPSAERGEPRAEYVLGIAHFNGDLVPEDAVRAYALMTRAAAAGLEQAKATLKTMDETLDLEDRQQGVALASDLEAKARSLRSTQFAAADLGATAAKAKRVEKASGERASNVVVIPPVITSTPAFPVVSATPQDGNAIAAAPRPSAALPAASGAGPWRVQLGAFGVPGNAQALWATLKSRNALAGLKPFYTPTGKLTRLLVGPFATQADGQKACAQLAGHACLVVKQ
jgi:TPR repeat protein